MKHFSDLPLDPRLLRAIDDAGYTSPTPIQAQAIPHLLEGRDLLGCARTGTGKTAAFALPILQRLAGQPRGGMRCLVLVPTRELASQVADSFADYGRHLDLDAAVIYGGVGQAAQVRALKAGADIVVATPGRLLDLANQGHVRFDRVQVLVLDEADHMLDLGFIPDVRRIVGKLPAKRQTLLFSATMPPAIAALADGMLSNPAKVMVSPPASTVELVEQSVHHVPQLDKAELLARLILQPEVESALVFTRTKRGADRVAKRLLSAGIKALAIHGNKAQAVRERSLKSFREGGTRVLVATDVAARGIDVDGISHVFNYELPHVPETYVHRIGRTGRAGAVGVAIALCSEDERSLLKDIEKLTKKPVRVVPPSETAKLPRVTFASTPAEAPYRDPRASSHRGSGRGFAKQASRGERGVTSRGERGDHSRGERGGSSRGERGGSSRGERGRPSPGGRANGARAARPAWQPVGGADAARGSRVEKLKGVRQDANAVVRQDAKAVVRQDAKAVVRQDAKHVVRQDANRAVRQDANAVVRQDASQAARQDAKPGHRRAEHGRETQRAAQPPQRPAPAPRPKTEPKPFHRPSGAPRLADDAAVLRRRARRGGSSDARD